MKLLLTEDHPTLKPYDQARWAELADSRDPALESSLAIVRGLHARWVRLLESLDESAWGRTGYHPEVGELTLDDLLRTYAEHGEAHLDQIRRARATRGRSG